MNTNENQMQLRAFNPDDAETILSWCKDKHAFRLWSADRYKDFPALPEEMMEQYKGDNMYPLTAVVDNHVIGHILLRYPSENKTVIRFGFVIVDDSKRSKGYGKQMLRLAIDYAKRELGAQKITLGVFDNNPSAIHCYESVGFVVTGTDTYAIDGEEWSGKEMELEIKKTSCKMMKEILYILLDNYAKHEIGFMPGAVSTDATGFRKEPKYINKMVAPTMEPVKSIGGMRTLPDYSFETMPADYAALVLIGGFGWMNSEAERVLPIVKDALSKDVVVGAICNAASWMAKQGLLNNIKHTGNGINQLKLWGGNNYTNEAGYVNEQAVTDGRIVTANGSGYLEFTRELLKLLENDTPEMINGWYTFMSDGLVKLYSPRPRFKFNTIGLFSSNNKATVDFYTKAFGFTTDWDGIQPNVEMMLGDMRIILYPRSDFEQMVSYKFQYSLGLNGTAELAFDVPSYADVDKEYQHALRHGAISVLPPTTEPWGQRTCYVADPDGNLIEIGSFTIEQNNH